MKKSDFMVCKIFADVFLNSSPAESLWVFKMPPDSWHFSLRCFGGMPKKRKLKNACPTLSTPFDTTSLKLLQGGPLPAVNGVKYPL